MIKVSIVILTIFYAVRLAPAQEPVKSDVSRFDGTWSVTLDCPTHTDGALGYMYQFSAQVKNGVLYGQ